MVVLQKSVQVLTLSSCESYFIGKNSLCRYKLRILRWDHPGFIQWQAEDETEETWGQREWCVYKRRNAKDCWQPPQARRGAQIRSSLTASRTIGENTFPLFCHPACNPLLLQLPDTNKPLFPLLAFVLAFPSFEPKMLKLQNSAWVIGAPSLTFCSSITLLGLSWLPYLNHNCHSSFPHSVFSTALSTFCIYLFDREGESTSRGSARQREKQTPRW